MPIKSLQSELLEVRRTLGRMDMVLAGITESVCVVDKENRIVFANDSFARLTQSPKILLLGKKFTEALDLTRNDAKLSVTTAIDKTIFQNPERLNNIYEYQLKKGTLHLKLSANYISTLDETVIMLQDITLQHELDNMKGKIITLASHQLRTPLSVINVYINMLKDGFAGDISKDQHDLIQNVLDGVTQMQQIIDTLLNTGRIESRNAKIPTAPTDVSEILNRVQKSLKIKLQEKNIKLTINKPANLKTINSSAENLHEIFSNLLVNAIQYSHEGDEIKVKIRTDADNNKIIISIADQGIGIPKDSYQQIFAPFNRADNAIVHQPDGSGLGLYTVKLLLEEINGSITVDSQLGKGTTFYVTLPADEL